MDDPERRRERERARAELHQLRQLTQSDDRSGGAALPAVLGGSSLRVVLIATVAAVAALAVWLVIKPGSSSVPPAADGSETAVAVTADGLRSASAAAGRPIFWQGPDPARTLELSQMRDGRVYVRYLPAGVAVGEKKPALSIGTYPVRDAFAVTSDVVGKSGFVRLTVPAGVAGYSKGTPGNVYLALPGQDYQVEVYSPDAQEAQDAVTSGAIAMVDPSVPTTVAAPDAPAAGTGTIEAEIVTPARLRAATASLSPVVYWLGPRPGTPIELSRTADGRTYVRYLPAGRSAGDADAALTVATYPYAGGYDATRKVATSPGSTPIPVAGGVAYATRSSQLSVHVAFEGVEAQYEVFAPEPGLAERLVRTGKIRPVR